MVKTTHTATKKQKTKRNEPETSEVLKLHRIGNLRNSKEIGRFVSRIVKLAARNQKKGGDITNNCYKLTMMASMLAKIIEGDELKQRVKELEGIVNKEKEKEIEINPSKIEPS
jgi:hypothetical protein